MDYVTYSVPAHFITAIYYADYSGLDRNEEKALNLFLHDINGELHFENDNVEQYFDPYHDMKAYGILPCDCVEMICIPN